MVSGSMYPTLTDVRPAATLRCSMLSSTAIWYVPETIFYIDNVCSELTPLIIYAQAKSVPLAIEGDSASS